LGRGSKGCGEGKGRAALHITFLKNAEMKGVGAVFLCYLCGVPVLITIPAISGMKWSKKRHVKAYKN